LIESKHAVTHHRENIRVVGRRDNVSLTKFDINLLQKFIFYDLSAPRIGLQGHCAGKLIFNQLS
jgi:ATP-dependent Clp protease adapter protein ClpS